MSNRNPALKALSKFVFAIFWFALILVVGNWNRLVSHGKPVQELTTISNWYIESSTLDAQILWQKSANFHNLKYWVAVSANSIALTGGVARGVTAFDKQSGEILWEHQLPNINGLISAPQGYVVGGQTGGQTTLLLSNVGDVLWQNQERYVRESRIRFVVTEATLYLPAQNTVYQYNLTNGQQIRVVSYGMHFLGAFQNFDVWHDEVQHLLVLRNFDTPSVPNLWETQIVETNIEFLGHSDNIIVLAIDKQKLRGYSTSTGQTLWEVNMPYRSATYQDSSVIVYSHMDEILFFNIYTGHSQGQIILKRHEDMPYNRDSIAADTFIASHGVIVIANGSTEEIVVISYPSD